MTTRPESSRSPRQASTRSDCRGTRLIGEQVHLLLGERITESNIRHGGEKRRLAEQQPRLPGVGVQFDMQNVALWKARDIVPNIGGKRSNPYSTTSTSGGP